MNFVKENQNLFRTLQRGVTIYDNGEKVECEEVCIVIKNDGTTGFSVMMRDEQGAPKWHQLSSKGKDDVVEIYVNDIGQEEAAEMVEEIKSDIKGLLSKAKNKVKTTVANAAVNVVESANDKLREIIVKKMFDGAIAEMEDAGMQVTDEMRESLRANSELIFDIMEKNQKAAYSPSSRCNCCEDEKGEEENEDYDCCPGNPPGAASNISFGVADEPAAKQPYEKNISSQIQDYVDNE